MRILHKILDGTYQPVVVINVGSTPNTKWNLTCRDANILCSIQKTKSTIQAFKNFISQKFTRSMSSINVSETKSLVFENGFLLFMFSNYLVFQGIFTGNRWDVCCDKLVKSNPTYIWNSFTTAIIEWKRNFLSPC